MDKLSPQQRHKKAAIKQEQSDAGIDSAERERTRRSANMAAIHSKDTKPEMIVRRGLWKRGFRYRLNHKRLPGHPDLVLRKYRTCIFVNGCFWHGHNVALPQMSDVRSKMEDVIENSECCKIPKTNRDFWVAKIRRNKERDREEQKKLAAMGWHCITVWECELKPSKREKTLESIAFTLNHIWLQDHQVNIALKCAERDEEDIQMPKAAEEEI
jgi:DNA mismatch endonuclease (patch repair protein)